jgi:hypothetical protein
MAETDIRDRFNWAASKHRRRLAADKLELLEGRHKATLDALIRARMTDPIAAAQVIKWATTSRNLLVQIVRTCCQAYARGCVRDLDAGVGTDATAAFSAVIAESQISIVSTLLNQYAWVLGPTFVIPQVEADGTFWLDLVPASRAEVKLTNPTTVSELLYQRADGLFVHLDGEAWRYYDSEGEPFKGLAPVTHGLGYAPLAVFRSEHWTSGDWWNSWSHRALVDAALDVANLEALLHWSRKQSNKQLVVYATREIIGSGQIVGHPELPLWFNGGPGDAKVEVIDLEGNATTYLDLINAKTAGVCELYGLPPSLLSGVNSNSDWGQVGLARAPEVLDALRDSQIDGLRFGEAQLWPAVCDLLRASTHKHARALLPGDEVRDALRLKFLEPLPNIDRARKRLELFELEEKYGLSTVTDLVIEQRPEMTREQAEQVIADNLARYFARLDEQARRNTPGGQLDAVDSLAEAQGRTGGLTRAANANAEADKAADTETSTS